MRVRRFGVVCRRCDMVLFHTVARIAEAELLVLREHLRAVHPADAVPDAALASAVLQPFVVGEVTP